MKINNLVDNTFGLFEQFHKPEVSLERRANKKHVDKGMTEQLVSNIQINTPARQKSVTQPNSALGGATNKHPGHASKRKHKSIVNPI